MVETEYESLKMINLDTFLPYRMATLSQKLSLGFASVYADKYGLTVPQWRVIAHLAERNALTAKEICDLAALDKSTASRAVKQLQEKHIIAGHASTTDKRATVLALTELGQELYEILSNDAKDWQDSLLSELSKDEQALLLKLLGKLENKV